MEQDVCMYNDGLENDPDPVHVASNTYGSCILWIVLSTLCLYVALYIVFDLLTLTLN